MAPVTFTLLALGPQASKSLLNSLKALDPLYIGQCHHWIHTPHLSTTALNGPGPFPQIWDYLLITNGSSPPTLSTTSISKSWSITGSCPDEMLASLPAANARRAGAPTPPLPPGWNSSDHSALDAAIAPSDLEASLDMTSRPMETSPSTSNPVALRDFIRTFGTTYTGPVAMFNLLSYLPSQRPKYFQYVEAFQESVGIKYGGEPVVLGFGVTDWSSRKEDEGGEGEWEDTALIWYPSIWHFGKMLDNGEYMDVDRRFKQGVLRDNPLMCCTEVRLEE